MSKCWNKDAQLRPDFELLHSELTAAVSKRTILDNLSFENSDINKRQGEVENDDESGYADDPRSFEAQQSKQHATPSRNIDDDSEEESAL